MKNKLNVHKVLWVLKNVLPKDKATIGLHEPYITGIEWVNVKECLDTGWVSSGGKFVDEFENKLAQYTGVKRAVAVVNGTSALFICLKLCGVKENDEVLVPTLTFVATANAVTYCGAIPHFVDSDERTLGLDPLKLEKYLNEIVEIRSEGSFNRETGRYIKAVIPVHTFGHPVDLDPLVDLCNRFGLTIIEDAAESLGSFYKGIHTGNWGRMSVLSFNGNKIVTTGGGGAILTNSETLADTAKHLTTTAKAPHRWDYYHDRVGYNFRLPNINAALGCSQLDQLSRFLECKRLLAQRYQEVFTDVEGITCFKEPEFARSNYWLNVLLLDEVFAGERDVLLELTHADGIMTRPAWTLLHKLPMFGQCPHMNLEVAESLGKRLINIPSSAFLGGNRAEA